MFQHADNAKAAILGPIPAKAVSSFIVLGTSPLCFSNNIFAVAIKALAFPRYNPDGLIMGSKSSCFIKAIRSGVSSPNFQRFSIDFLVFSSFDCGDNISDTKI